MRERFVKAWALALVLCAAAFLRFYHLPSVPAELIADEIDLYNSAQSIATSGHDIDGTLRPFLYSKFTRNPPVYAVAGYASTLVFGKNAFALRLPAVLFGLAAVLLVYGIALRLSDRRDIALAAALLTATQPVFVQFSRVAWEPASELPFLLGGLFALVCAVRSGLPLRTLLVAALLLGITAYTYMAGWFYAAVLGGSLVALNARTVTAQRAWPRIAAACALWLLIAAPALQMVFLDPSTAGKVSRIATFANGISWDSLRVFFANYAAHFHASYLVTTGDPKPGVTWRYLNGFGAFYWFVVPLAAAGATSVFGYVRSRALALWILVWLAAYPLGGALTNEGAPNAPRTLAGAPVFCLLAAFGIALFADWAARKLRRSVYAAFAVACAISTIAFAQFYFNGYVHRNSNAWDSGTRALFTAIRARSSKYSRVCFNVRPASYEVDPYRRFYLSGERIDVLDDATDPSCALPQTLLATDQPMTQWARGYRLLSEIRDVDGATFAFLLVRRGCGETGLTVCHAAIRGRARRGNDLGG